MIVRIWSFSSSDLLMNNFVSVMAMATCGMSIMMNNFLNIGSWWGGICSLDNSLSGMVSLVCLMCSDVLNLDYIFKLLYDINMSGFMLFGLQDFFNVLVSGGRLFNFMNFCLMFLWFHYCLYMCFSCTRLGNFYNLFLMLFGFQYMLNMGWCRSWLLNFFNNLFMFSWLDDFNNLSTCALRNVMDNISVFHSLRKNFFNNLSRSRLWDMLNYLLVLDSFWKNLLDNFSRGTLGLFNHHISNFLLLW